MVKTNKTLINVTNDKGDITKDTTEIKKILRGHYKQFVSNKFEILDKTIS